MSRNKTIDTTLDGCLRLDEFLREFGHLEGLAKELQELLFAKRDEKLFIGTDMDEDGVNRLYDGMNNAFNRSIASQAHEVTY